MALSRMLLVVNKDERRNGDGGKSEGNIWKTNSNFSRDRPRTSSANQHEVIWLTNWSKTCFEFFSELGIGGVNNGCTDMYSAVNAVFKYYGLQWRGNAS